MVVEFNQVYELLPPGFILWCISTICIEFLLVQLELVELIFRFVTSIIFALNCFPFPRSKIVHEQQAKGENFANTVNAFALVLPLLGILLIISEFGEMLNSQFAAFDERLYQCHFYRFPIKVQRVFRTFLMYSQDSVNIQGFGNTKCTRQTFKNVSIDFFKHALCDNGGSD